MNVFVAGATGTLGQPLVRALVRQGHTVAGMTRRPARRALVEQLGAQAVIADALDAQALMAAVKRAAPTHVVHLLTALPPKGPMRVADIVATNRLRIAGTANLLQAAIAAGATRIVGESFVHVYGYGDLGAQPLTEDQPLPPFGGDPALRSVVDALRALEAQLIAANTHGRIEAVVLRYGLLYGADNPGTRSMLELVRRRRLPLLRGGSGVGTMVDVGDAVSATIAALEHGRPGAIYNIVDDLPVDFNSMIVQMAAAVGARPPRALPAWLMRLSAPALVASMQSRLPVSNALARRELRWRPQYPTYREGLRHIVGQLST